MRTTCFRFLAAWRKIGFGIVFALALTSCARQPEHEVRDVRPEEVSSVLQNMPVNKDNRCVGITAVAEALLDGERADGQEDAPEQLAEEIYKTLKTGGQVRYGGYLLSDGKSLTIDSTQALEMLSTLVSDLYKEDYYRSIQTTEGRRRLSQVARSFVRTRKEMKDLLEDDTDRMDVFYANGIRCFPDGTVKTTHHAVLIHITPNGEMSIFDPNDPGASIPCQIETDQHGLVIQWTCQYKDTGLVTTQRYHIVPRDKYFGTALCEDQEIKGTGDRRL